MLSRPCWLVTCWVLGAGCVDRATLPLDVDDGDLVVVLQAGQARIMPHAVDFGSGETPTVFVVPNERLMGPTFEPLDEATLEGIKVAVGRTPLSPGSCGRCLSPPFRDENWLISPGDLCRLPPFTRVYSGAAPVDTPEDILANVDLRLQFPGDCACDVAPQTDAVELEYSEFQESLGGDAFEYSHVTLSEDGTIGLFSETHAELITPDDLRLPHPPDPPFRGPVLAAVSCGPGCSLVTSFEEPASPLVQEAYRHDVFRIEDGAVTQVRVGLADRGLSMRASHLLRVSDGWLVGGCEEDVRPRLLHCTDDVFEQCDRIEPSGGELFPKDRFGAEPCHLAFLGALTPDRVVVLSEFGGVQVLARVGGQWTIENGGEPTLVDESPGIQIGVYVTGAILDAGHAVVCRVKEFGSTIIRGDFSITPPVFTTTASSASQCIGTIRYPDGGLEIAFLGTDRMAFAPGALEPRLVSSPYAPLYSGMSPSGLGFQFTQTGAVIRWKNGSMTLLEGPSHETPEIPVQVLANGASRFRVFEEGGSYSDVDVREDFSAVRSRLNLPGQLTAACPGTGPDRYYLATMDPNNLASTLWQADLSQDPPRLEVWGQFDSPVLDLEPVVPGEVIVATTRGLFRATQAGGISEIEVNWDDPRTPDVEGPAVTDGSCGWKHSRVPRPLNVHGQLDETAPGILDVSSVGGVAYATGCDGVLIRIVRDRGQRITVINGVLEGDTQSVVRPICPDRLFLAGHLGIPHYRDTGQVWYHERPEVGPDAPPIAAPTYKHSDPRVSLHVGAPVDMLLDGDQLTIVYSGSREPGVKSTIQRLSSTLRFRSARTVQSSAIAPDGTLLVPAGNGWYIAGRRR